MKTTRFARISIFTIITSLSGLPPCVSQAASFEAVDASNFLSSVTMLTDMVTLQTIFGVDNSVFDISSNFNNQGWTSTITGSYLGQPINLTYSGNTTNFSSTGDVSWIDYGSYGTSAWSGTGTATFSNSSSSTNYVYNMFTNIGANSATTNLTSNLFLGSDYYSSDMLSGAIITTKGTSIVDALNGWYPFILSTNPKVSLSIGYDWFDNKTGKRKSTIFGFKLSCEFSNPNCNGTGTITIPEPSSFALLSIGCLGLFVTSIRKSGVQKG